jgi:TolB protein
MTTYALRIPPRRLPPIAGALLLALLLPALLALSAPAAAQLRIDVTRGVEQPLPVAVTDFHGESEAEARIGRDIAGVIAANLNRSGLFRPLNPNAFIQTPEALQAGPRFADWRIIDAQALVSGSVAEQPDGRLRVEFRLWDVIAEQQMTGLAYQTEPENWRRVAHIVSDAVYQALTGEPGYFDTRIVYISETGTPDRRIKRLAIMDQDGANHRYLTDGSALVLTPRFSPSTEEITYLSYAGGRPRVFLYNIQTGQQEVLGDFPGMTFAPRFSPDGNRVIMSLSQGGNADIYMMDLRTRQVQRLTTHPGIDTSPSYSADGQQIVFESDRGGSQQIYVMNADGSDPRRISFGNGRYGEPVWSPRGDLIAFTRIVGGRFGIGVMSPSGERERMLTESFHVEGPTWAPNGRVLMYFTETPSGPGGTQRIARLHAIDVTGTNSWIVPTPADGSDPAWSPLIP